jgi:hypothetical protein
MQTRRAVHDTIVYEPSPIPELKRTDQGLLDAVNLKLTSVTAI